MEQVLTCFQYVSFQCIVSLTVSSLVQLSLTISMFTGNYVRALELLAMQIQEKNEDSDAVTQKFLRRLRNNKKRLPTTEDRESSTEADDEVEEANCGTQRTMQPSQRLIKAVEENETTTDTEK